MSIFLRSLLLSAALATLVCAAPIRTVSIKNDPCAILGSLNTTEITIQQVSSCYRSIEFNDKEAKSTLDSLHTLYRDFFVFRDDALTPKLALPFTSTPVDILAELERIRETKYTTDFDFHSDLTLLAQSLNDAHVTYGPDCYNSIAFVQPLFLYAPTVNGRQAIRVYQGKAADGFEDCEVLEIDGVDAHSYIQAWADKYTGYSKDAGVRFNRALVSQAYSWETKTWDRGFGSFSFRTSLPESDYLDYRIRCDSPKASNNKNANGTVSARVAWKVIRPKVFADKASFLKNVCIATPPPASTHTDPEANLGPRHQNPIMENVVQRVHRREVHLREYAEKQDRQLKKRASGEPAPSLQDFTDAIFVDGNVTAVYQLKSKPHVGILVLPTMDVSISTEVPSIQARLAKLAARGVTNIIIDTYGNGGGDVSFASYLVSIFFPTTDKRTSSHVCRFRDSPAAMALAGADLANTTVGTYFEPTTLANTTTDKVFTTNFFKDPINMTANGRVAQYTDEFYLDFDLASLESTTYPWSGDASKIILLTDGQCGSACGMLSELLVSKHGVKAVAVGGHASEELSMFSFPGAAVLGLDDLVGSFEKLSVPSPLARLPYKNTVNIGVIKMYSGNDTTPLEYNPKRYVAAHRLDYTPETARNHDQLWVAAAETVWA